MTRASDTDEAHDPPEHAAWRVARALFDEATELPVERRAAYVHAHALDESIAREVLELLALDAEHPDEALAPALDAVLRDAVEDPDGTPQDEDRLGTMIGAYRLDRVLGRGGMGVVYEATRADGEFAQHVAIKLLRAGHHSPAAARRFRRERQLLAALRHPNIAALLDGGVTVDGVPFLVLELVEGRPITRFADERGLGVRERVQLARQVCAAVQHAHAHLVVHRDLKPSNILVDASGRVRLLDFGISRLLAEPDGGAPLTETVLHSLTPEYASPEQFTGDSVGVASDIYSLGVVLHELLVGAKPYTLEGLSWPAMVRRVTEQAMVPPSRAAHDASRRGLLRGDLDAMLLQAMAREPARRYATVEQFDADLAAWLVGRPVRARAPSLAYRAGKFVRRRPLELSVTTLALVALMASVVISRTAADRAKQEQARTAQVNRFLQDMLATANPDVGSRDMTVREALGLAARRLQDSTLPADLRSELHFTLAGSYYGLGDWPAAARHADSAYAMRAHELGRTALPTLDARVLQANAAEALGDIALAIALIEEAVTALRAARRIDDARLATALEHQARILELTGDRARVDALTLEALALRERSRDSAARAGLPNALNNRAVTLTYAGRADEATETVRRAIAEESRLHGTRSPQYAEYTRHLAELLAAQGQFVEADTLMRDALQALERALGPQHTTYLRARAAAVLLRMRANDPRGALAYAEPVIAAIGDALPEGDLTAASVLQYAGAAYDSLGEFAAGEAALQRALALRRASLPPSHWAIGSAEAILGAHHLLTRRYAAAEPLLRRGYDAVSSAQGTASPQAAAIAARLAGLYAATGRAEDAARWRARSDGTVP